MKLTFKNSIYVFGEGLMCVLSQNYPNSSNNSLGDQLAQRG